MANKNCLSDDDKKYVEEYLNETEEKRKEYIEIIQKWFEDNANINGKSDEEAILPFLRGCKYNLERTKQKLTKFYLMKSEVPEWFSNRDASSTIIQDLIKLGVFVPLKDTHDNKLVVIMRIAAHDPKLYSIDDVVKVALMVIDIFSMENESAQIYGVIAIFDLENISFEHAKQITPYLVKKTVNAWQNYYCRPKQLEFINAPFYINAFLKLFKAFMTEKLKNRMRVHSYGVEATHNIVAQKILPMEYGGDQESINIMAERWGEKLLTYKEWFKRDENYKTILD